ncbi:MAG: hypothetical protein U0166_27850 [Acidobacteriota bacterium]
MERPYPGRIPATTVTIAATAIVSPDLPPALVSTERGDNPEVTLRRGGSIG